VSDQGKPEHPAPWRWIGEPPRGELTGLEDANGDALISGSDLPEAFYVDAPGVRELIRLAPDLEDALRYFVGMTDGMSSIHPKAAKARELLAALDAARKAEQ